MQWVDRAAMYGANNPPAVVQANFDALRAIQNPDQRVADIRLLAAEEPGMLAYRRRIADNYGKEAKEKQNETRLTRAIVALENQINVYDGGSQAELRAYMNQMKARMTTIREERLAKRESDNLSIAQTLAQRRKIEEEQARQQAIARANQAFRVQLI